MILPSVLGQYITTNAAAVAAAIASTPATTTAEAQALGDLLTVLSKRPDLLQNALQVSVLAKTGIRPSG